MSTLIDLFTNPYIGSYTPLLDGCVILLSTYLISILHPFTSLKDNKNNRTLFIMCLVLLDTASVLNIISHRLSLLDDITFFGMISICDAMYAINLGLVFYIFVIFYWSLTHANVDMRHKNNVFVSLIVICYIVIRLLCLLIVLLNSNYKDSFNMISIYSAFLFYLILGTDVITVFLKYDRKNNITHYYVKVSALLTYAFLILTVVVLHTKTYVTLLFFTPMLSILYFHHSYSFDVVTGSVDYNGFVDYLKKHMMYGNKNVYCGSIVEFVSTDSMNEYVSSLFQEEALKSVKLFSYKSLNQYIYLYRKDDAASVRTCLKKNFDVCDAHYMCSSFDDLTKVDIILSVVRGVFFTFKYNGSSKWKILQQKDIDKYIRLDAIRSEMIDICNKYDLDDPRVLVYCQPIYNTHTNSFDTAEALMRMELPGLGFIYPNEFIPIAEEFHLIHNLTLVILNKVSSFIEQCNKDGYNIKRISVNLSMDEFRNKNMCKEIYDIIGKYDIQNNQIALELTESVDNIDVSILSAYLNDIKSHNILLYLDDFGTGYSNFSRIYELPFDVIKFDMHLLSNSLGGKAKSINSVIPSFKDNGFELVHEGVETEIDEQSCIDLGFDYLQGYKYSKPIPINELILFLNKKS